MLKSIIKYFLICIFYLIFVNSNCLADSISLNNNVVPYTSYIYNYWEEPVPVPPPYIPDKFITGNTIGIDSFKKASDLYVSRKNYIYIADSGNNRIVVLNPEWKVSKIITEFDNKGSVDRFNNPQGICVTDNQHLFVADTGNARIIEFDSTGTLLREIDRPETVPGIIEDDFKFLPKKIDVDKAGRIYVIAHNVYDGIMQFDVDGQFQGFIGAPQVNPNVVSYIWKRYFSTEEQKDRMQLILPTEYNNFDLDYRGFLYTTVASGGLKEDQAVRKLNPSGEDVLRRNGFYMQTGDINAERWVGSPIEGKTSFVDIKVRENGIYIVLDQNRGRIFTYNNNGYLLFVFGYRSDQLGNFSNPVALDIWQDRIIVLDESRGLTVFKPTDYSKSILAAINYHYSGDYEQSTAMWQKVIRYNSNYELAYTGLGRAYLRQGQYEMAMKSFKLGNNREEYSEAMELNRKKIVMDNFGWLVLILIGYILTVKVIKKNLEKLVHSPEDIPLIIKRLSDDKKVYNTIKRTAESLRYGLYLIFHPFKGFWNLKHERTGTFTAASIILFLVNISYIFMRQFTGFTFNTVDPAKLNILLEITSVFLPFILWCIINWSLTTLMNGKGKFKDIYISTAYGLIPLIIINIPITVISNFLTIEEGAFFYFFITLAVIWSGFLIFIGNMIVHDYSSIKTIFTSVLTFAGMTFSIFIGLLFFNLTERIMIFAIEIFNEISYRS